MLGRSQIQLDGRILVGRRDRSNERADRQVETASSARDLPEQIERWSVARHVVEHSPAGRLGYGEITAFEGA
jgi:hypothetical protein